MSPQTSIQHATNAAGYGTGGLSHWITDNIITLVILILGITVLWAARSGNISKAVTIVGGLIIGLGVLGLATGNTATDVGSWMAGLFKG
ncbi:MAG: hypothetical protein J2O46_08220 [Nocardioides sp.]|nr:hypothetical protein [Nocardioides sp.]